VQNALHAVDRIRDDLAAFAHSESLDHVIVLNVASTEPPFALSEIHQRWDLLSGALAANSPDLLPASSLYALAAFREGHTYINFTPSLGGSIPALAQLAGETGSLYAGKDGKTGETLMKTVLAPMFALRNLRVLSWVGHNIFGNRDGLVLDDPANKSSKVDSKDQVLGRILGYQPASVVTIEYLADMGDWKTAWDHIHFQGFLGTKMTLQFTWQGCDSLLAAPLAIDLARLADLDKRQGGRGLMRHLACFFKSPEGVDENDFFRQFELLASHLVKRNVPADGQIPAQKTRMKDEG
jgi:myo-inositol-1-phosphate synthase